MKKIIIVGGGFGGLATAKALKKTNAEVLLFDRTNHHLFQPLLYQVATSVLSPGQIGYPLRGSLRNQKNTTVIMGEVTGVDKNKNCVFVDNEDRHGVAVTYDYLVLATGANHSYFGHQEFEQYAPGMKTLADAVDLRNKIQSTFELAEAEEDPSRHQDLLTFILVGAGPTGVELAGSLAVMIRTTLKSEFRRINPESARIVLLDRSPRVLSSFSDQLSIAAKKRLEELGVDVRSGHSVDQIDADGVVVGGERILSKTVIWTAGVAPSPASKWLNAETDHAGRVLIKNDLSIAGNPEIFVIGDTASFNQNGRPLPGVAQVALQQGNYVGKLLDKRIKGITLNKPFNYKDKGTMAVVGKGFAVLQTGKLHSSGFMTWLAWSFVHLWALAQPSMRLSVFAMWVWTYFTNKRGSRIIITKCQRKEP